MMKVLPPLSLATERTKATLFQPFDIGKWFALGFSAFLAALLTGGAGNLPSFGGDWKPSTDANGTPSLPSLPNWGWEVWGLIICAVLVLVVVFLFLIVWLGCRGQFMFLDNLLKNRCDVKAPWREFKKHGNSLMSFYFSLSTFVVLIALVLCLAGYLVWPHDSAAATWTQFAPVILLAVLLVIFCVSMAIVNFFMIEFGVLLMYRNGGSAWEAASTLGRLATENATAFIGYLLVRIVMSLLITLASVVIGCATCCIGFLPYVCSVLTLPLSTYRMWYTVECFAQLGPDYDLRLPTAEEGPLAII